MASNKTGMTAANGVVRKGLGNALIKIVGIGFAGGAVLIGSAKALGEAIESKQAEDLDKLEKRREADKEEVRRISENSTDPGL
jgi:cell division protein FtsB